jgi:hypothetical protein
MKRKAVLTWLQTEKQVKVEPSPPYVKELDGAAERSGGITKDKARAMRQAAKLPAALWPFIYIIGRRDTNIIGSRPTTAFIHT